MEHVMKSNVVQYCIIALVIADCLIIVLELLIDMDFIVFPESDPPTSHHTNGDSHPVAYASHHGNITTQHPEPDHQHNESSLYNSSSHHNSSHGGHHPHHHTNKEKAEHILHAFSLGILSLFMVEVCMKIYVEGKHLLRQKAEVFDAVVVVVSFTLDIVFSFVSVESVAKDAAGLMVLLRLWRVTRIINGVILSVKIEAKKKTDALKKVIRQLEHDNRKQRSKIDKLEVQSAAAQTKNPYLDRLGFLGVSGGSERQRKERKYIAQTSAGCSSRWLNKENKYHFIKKNSIKPWR